MDAALPDLPPFRPHPLLAHAAAMTAAGALAVREPAVLAASGEDRVLASEGQNRVRVRTHLRPGEGLPGVLLIHGLVGSLSSAYVVGTARKAFARGFQVVRMNVRNCGNTEHLAADPYHGGTTGDVLAVARAMVATMGIARVYLAGFSLGGNMAVKLAGELGSRAPEWLAGIVALSPCLDLAAAAERMNASTFGRLCQRRFLRDLRGIVLRRRALHDPALDVAGIERLRTIRAFDDRFTAPLGGFDGVDDYYARASAIRVAADVRVPTVLIASRDDPLVPFQTLERPEIASNRAIAVVATPRGGHVAFLARRRPELDLDRRWGESRIVQICAHAEHRRGHRGEPW